MRTHRDPSMPHRAPAPRRFSPLSMLQGAPRTTAQRASAALALTGSAALGVGAGAYLAARQISGPQRPALPYGFTPYEVGAPAEDVQFHASDGTALAGWWLDHPGSARPDGEHVVIVCHGHRGNKADMLGIGPGLWRAGFTVLMFDFRGNGDSADGPQSLAHYEQRDLEAAIDLAQQRRPDAQIDVVGFSMGAAVALLVAARDGRVQHVLADSAFADLHGVVTAAARGLRLPPVPLVELVDRVTRLAYGYGFREVEPVEAVAGIAPRPLLLIHGSDDATIPVEHAHRLADAAGDGATLQVVDGAGHCGAYFADRPGYIARAADFLRS